MGYNIIQRIDRLIDDYDNNKYNEDPATFNKEAFLTLKDTVRQVTSNSRPADGFIALLDTLNKRNGLSTLTHLFIRDVYKLVCKDIKFLVDNYNDLMLDNHTIFRGGRGYNEIDKDSNIVYLKKTSEAYTIMCKSIGMRDTLIVLKILALISFRVCYKGNQIDN